MQDTIEITNVQDIPYCDASHLDIVDRDLLVETVYCIEEAECHLLEFDILETLRTLTSGLQLPTQSSPVKLAHG